MAFPLVEFIYGGIHAIQEGGRTVIEHRIHVDDGSRRGHEDQRPKQRANRDHANGDPAPMGSAGHPQTVNPADPAGPNGRSRQDPEERRRSIIPSLALS